jgi:acyl carrier protein
MGVESRRIIGVRQILASQFIFNINAGNIMSGENTIKEPIRLFIIQKFPAARKRRLQDDMPLLESGIVDSLGILDVVAFLETSFLIQVSDDELTPDNFGNINCLTSFVEKKKTPIEVSAQ